jgi:hypothetical protein
LLFGVKRLWNAAGDVDAGAAEVFQPLAQVGLCPAACKYFTLICAWLFVA